MSGIRQAILSKISHYMNLSLVLETPNLSGFQIYKLEVID